MRNVAKKKDLISNFQTKKIYEKAFRESEKAQDGYQKADADLNLSRAELEKVSLILKV